MSEGKVVVTKLGEDPKKTPVKPISLPKLEGGKKLKTFPKGILKTAKIKPVKDPAKHPRLKKFMRKHTIRLLTDSGVSHRKKTIKQKVGRMSDERVRDVVIKTGLSKGNSPPALLREILEGGMLAGFVSST